MKQQISIAFHDPRLASTTGGGETLTLTKIESLDASRFRPVIVTRAGKRSALFTQFLQRNPHVEVLAITAPEAGLPAQVEALLNEQGGRLLWGKDHVVDDGIRFNAEAHKLYRERSFDLVSCSFVTDIFGLPPMRSAVFHLYGCPPADMAEAEAPLLHRFHRLSAVSAYVRDEFSRLMLGSTEPGGIEILPPALGPAFSVSAESKSRRTADFLFAGRLVHRKGVDILLESLALLNKRRMLPATAMIVGDGAEGDLLRSTCIELGLGEVVTFHGAMSQEDLAAVMRRTRCFVYPVRKPEAFGLVPLEAMSQGAVPILGVLGGMAEYAEHGSNAFVLPAGFDADSLANVMAGALSDERRLAVMAENGRRTARRFNWKDFSQRLDRFLHEALQRM